MDLSTNQLDNLFVRCLKKLFNEISLVSLLSEYYNGIYHDGFRAIEFDGKAGSDNINWQYLMNNINEQESNLIITSDSCLGGIKICFHDKSITYYRCYYTIYVKSICEELLKYYFKDYLKQLACLAFINDLKNTLENFTELHKQFM